MKTVDELKAVIPKRGLVCCFCGEAWGYEGEQPTDALLKQAVDHEAQCPRNPYIAEINELRRDKQRLEWCLKQTLRIPQYSGNDGAFIGYGLCKNRYELDKAMKQEKP